MMMNCTGDQMEGACPPSIDSNSSAFNLTRILEIQRKLQRQVEEIYPYVMIFVFLDILIIIVGVIGNSLVIYVVSRFAKMQNVTNVYFLNLATADVVFLLGMPLLVVAAIQHAWTLGFAMCKVYIISQSVNQFTSIFLLVVLSGDRYLAVCHPLAAQKYRTFKNACFVCLGVWVTSLLVMLPLIIYSKTHPNFVYPGKKTCTIIWPQDGRTVQEVFTWYSFVLGFGVPLVIIILFYSLVIHRLMNTGARDATGARSQTARKQSRKVNRMVVGVISAYIICYLPFWIAQIALNYIETDLNLSPMSKIIIHMATGTLMYANSMLNPILYAFLSESFRKSFILAFRCVTHFHGDSPESGRQRGRKNQTSGAKTRLLTSRHEEIELDSPPQFDRRTSFDVTEITTIRQQPSPTRRRSFEVTELPVVRPFPSPIPGCPPYSSPAPCCRPYPSPAPGCRPHPSPTGNGFLRAILEDIDPEPGGEKDAEPRVGVAASVLERGVAEAVEKTPEPDVVHEVEIHLKLNRAAAAFTAAPAASAAAETAADSKTIMTTTTTTTTTMTSTTSTTRETDKDSSRAEN